MTTRQWKNLWRSFRLMRRRCTESETLAWIRYWNKSDYWVVRRCAFPYPEGYATYNPKKRTVLDTGLPLEQARAICRELNKEEL